MNFQGLVTEEVFHTIFNKFFPLGGKIYFFNAAIKIIIKTPNFDNLFTFILQKVCELIWG